MDWAAAAYLGITFGLFAIFAVIVFRTFRRKHKKRIEEPKHRMLDDE